MRTLVVSLWLVLMLTPLGRSAEPPKHLPFIQKALEKAARETQLTLDVDLRIQQPGSALKSQVNLTVLRSRDRFALVARGHGEMQGMQVDVQGEARYLEKVFYFVLKQSPFGKPEEIGQWFALDSSLVPRPELAQKIEIPKETRWILDIKEKPKETLRGNPMRHFEARVSLADLAQIFLSQLPREGALAQKRFQPDANLPPLPVHFWIGAKDGRLHQILVPIMKDGKVRLSFAYGPKKGEAPFTAPQDPIDARALNLFRPRMMATLFQFRSAPAKRNVQEIPGTTISLLPLSPYGGPEPERLKAYLEKQFGLGHVEVLPALPVEEKSFDTYRMQYAAEDLLQQGTRFLQEKKLEQPGRTLVLLTDKNLYSKQSPNYEFISTLSQGNQGVVSFFHLKSSSDPDLTFARSRKVLARSLGILYWKLSPTTLPQDLLFDSVSRIPEDFDEMGEEFLQDESFPFLEEGLEKLSAGQYEEARKALSRAVELNPLNARGYFSLGKAEFETGAYESSVDHLGKGLVLAPGTDETFYLLGQCYEKLSNPKRALWEYRASAFLNPKRPEFFSRLASVYHDLGMEEKAKEAREKAEALKRQEKS